VVILTQDWCTICTEHTIGLEIALDAPDGTPRLHGSCGITFWSVWRQYQCRFKKGARFAPNVSKAYKSFWIHLMELLGCAGHVESHFGLLGDSVSVGQDRCMVYAKRTNGSEIILDAADGTHRV
jgi:hypothetical protein